MILSDWRDADAALMQACYAREQQSWQEDLGWDTAWTWATVEEARRGHGLPGVLARADDGALLGWGFAMADAGRLHIGGLVASSASVTSAILDWLLAAVPAQAAACFVRDRAPGLGEMLTARGWIVEPFLYLVRPITPDEWCVAPVVDPADSWRSDDFVAAIDVLRRAYTPEAGVHFAPAGTFADWAKYLSGMVQQAGCGRLDPAATRVARDADGLQAIAMVTCIGDGTMHLAQLAVRPEVRGRGVATRLMREAIASAAERGATAITLLVGERNSAARRLYDSFGFAERGRFIAARTRRTAEGGLAISA